jgi:hypothetical protein
MKIISLAISPPDGFSFGSNPISRAQALPKSGVYQIKPKMKLTTTAIKTATILTLIS